jgi:hypothetical protein
MLFVIKNCLPLNDVEFGSTNWHMSYAQGWDSILKIIFLKKLFLQVESMVH